MAEDKAKKSFSDEQMNALEALIVYSNKSKLGRKTLIWVLRQTQNLSNPICLFIPIKTKGFASQRFDDNDFWTWAEQVKDCIHGIGSSMGQTHLDLIFRAMGSDLRIYGHSTKTGIYVSFSHNSDFLHRVSNAYPNYPYDEVQKVKVRSPYGTCDSAGEPFLEFK